MATCDKAVGKGVVANLCDEEQGHEGPCASRDNIRSVAERKQWSESLQETIEPNLTEVDAPISEVQALGMQGPPKTSVEGLVSEEQRDSRREHPANVKLERLGIETEVDERDPSTPLGGVAFLDSLNDDGPVSMSEERRKRHLITANRHRDGDQDLPTTNTGVHIHDLVIHDVRARKELGTQRYGTPLGTFNGRNSVLDAYEESLDQTVYLKQILEERKQLVIAIGDLFLALNQEFGSRANVPQAIDNPLTFLWENLK